MTLTLTMTKYTATIVDRKAGTRKVGIQRQALSSSWSFTVAARKNITFWREFGNPEIKHYKLQSTMTPLRILKAKTSYQAGATLSSSSKMHCSSILRLLGTICCMFMQLSPFEKKRDTSSIGSDCFKQTSLTYIVPRFFLLSPHFP